MFEVDSFDEASKTIGWSKGGFQGARGNDRGAEWYIENVFELLDAENEFFYDEKESKLYYFYNGTSAPPADLPFEVPQLQTLKAIKGTQKEPVKKVCSCWTCTTAHALLLMHNALIHCTKALMHCTMRSYSALIHCTIHCTMCPCTVLYTALCAHTARTARTRQVELKGVTFKDSRYTYMEPHGVPSGGDWALQRMGGVFIEGAENVTIEQCLFTRLDGNALFLSGYVRGAVIQDNEFVWIGDSVMASWGYTMPLGGKHGDDILAKYKSGIDGTGGEQPRGTQVLHNFIHELVIILL
jgi:hypothetical protein